LNSEVIKAVHEAEGNAEEIIKSARIRTKEINADAHAKAEAAAAAIHAEARRKAHAMLEAARAEAQADVDRFMESNRQEGEALKCGAREHLNKARDYVIGRIVK
jgi:vacuolar-type H+-ATPase subunit H